MSNIKKKTNLKVKYNRVSTLQQTGERFSLDKKEYDYIFFDKVSGSVPFSERPNAKELLALIEDNRISELCVESLDRLGRNTGDVISTLQYLDNHSINIIVRNIGLQSRPNCKKNPIWKMVSSTLSALYEMELENIKERTMAGRIVYQVNGGKFGRPIGSNESEKQFLAKPKTKEIIKWLNKGRTIREIASHTSSSNKTIIKVKKTASKHGLLVSI